MKKLSNKEMKDIYGGVVSPPDSTCGVQCPNGEFRSKDCGFGVNCVSDGQTQTVWCDDTEYCPCD